MEIYDISLGIDKEMLVYPKNPKPRLKRYSSIPKNLTNESLICIGSHTGTHFDSALHVYNKGWSTAKPKLDSFYGKAVVVDVTNCRSSIKIGDLSKRKIPKGYIVLLKTINSNKNFKKFRKDYVYLDISGAKYLVSIKAKAVGIDYLGIEKFGGDMSVHKALLRRGIPIFEGLYLKNIKPGIYTFIGFPLKVDIDAAPLRAVLIK